MMRQDRFTQQARHPVTLSEAKSLLVARCLAEFILSGNEGLSMTIGRAE